MDVKTMMSSWLMAAVQMKDGWRYALATIGEQWPVVDGAPMRPKLSVDNLAIRRMVRRGSRVYQGGHFRARVIIFTFLAHPVVEHFSSSYFGQGYGFIFLDNVACNGNETSLTSCSYTTPTSDDSHSKDAGVRCPGQKHLFCACIINSNENNSWLEEVRWNYLVIKFPDEHFMRKCAICVQEFSYQHSTLSLCKKKSRSQQFQ